MQLGIRQGAQTRRYLYVLISPKRCSTRKISRLSDRFAGRGWMRRWTDRDARSWEEALRTADMAGSGEVEVRCEPRWAQSLRKAPKDQKTFPTTGVADHVETQVADLECRVDDVTNIIR